MSEDAQFWAVGGMRFQIADRDSKGGHVHSEGVCCPVNGTWPDGASWFCDEVTFTQIANAPGRLVERSEWAARRDAKRRKTPSDRDALVALILGGEPR